MSDPIISVVIATLNRPERLARLLKDIKAQDEKNFEVLIIDDGSDPETIAQYTALSENLDERFSFMLKTKAEKSSGPSISRNKGIRAARGQYVAFCDDDDTWIREDHLSVAVRALTDFKGDVFFANMQTTSGGAIKNPNMYGNFHSTIAKNKLSGNDIFLVEKRDAAEMMQHRIIHSDTLVVRRSLYEQSGFYWEKLRFAEDQDMAFRLVDAANCILYRSSVVGDFEVGPHESLAYTHSDHDRIIFGIAATIHAEYFVKDRYVRRVSKKNRSWRLFELGNNFFKTGDRQKAMHFCLQSLGTSPSISAIKLLAKILLSSPPAAAAKL